MASREKLIGNTPQSILVALPGENSIKLFWGHGCIGTARMAVKLLIGPHLDCNSKVCKNCSIVLVKKNIFWFKITVYNIMLMNCMERIPNLLQNGQGFIYRYWRRIVYTFPKSTIRGIFNNDIWYSFAFAAV